MMLAWGLAGAFAAPASPLFSMLVIDAVCDVVFYFEFFYCVVYCLWYGLAGAFDVSPPPHSSQCSWSCNVVFCLAGA